MKSAYDCEECVKIDIYIYVIYMRIHVCIYANDVFAYFCVWLFDGGVDASLLFFVERAATGIRRLELASCLTLPIDKKANAVKHKNYTVTKIIRMYAIRVCICIYQ